MVADNLPPSKWLQVIRRPESQNVQLRLRVFCFPHAGASPVMFHARWAKSFPPEVQVIGIHYPGRALRHDEKCFEDLKLAMNSLISDVSFVFKKPYFLPYVVVGHSFGAACGYEFIRQIQRAGFSLPIDIILSGRNPVQLGKIDSTIYDLPVDELQKVCQERYKTPIITDAELLKLAIPPLRADIKSLDFYLPDPYDGVKEVPFPVSLNILVGERDHMIPQHLMDKWGEHTSLPHLFRKVIFPGLHHFFYEKEEYISFLRKRFENGLVEIDINPELDEPLVPSAPPHSSTGVSSASFCSPTSVSSASSSVPLPASASSEPVGGERPWEMDAVDDLC